MSGYPVEGSNESLGVLRDFVLDDETWQIGCLVVAGATRAMSLSGSDTSARSTGAGSKLRLDLTQAELATLAAHGAGSPMCEESAAEPETGRLATYCRGDASLIGPGTARTRARTTQILDLSQVRVVARIRESRADMFADRTRTTHRRASGTTCPIFTDRFAVLFAFSRGKRPAKSYYGWSERQTNRLTSSNKRVC